MCGTLLMPPREGSAAIANTACIGYLEGCGEKHSERFLFFVSYGMFFGNREESAAEAGKGRSPGRD